MCMKMGVSLLNTTDGSEGCFLVHDHDAVKLIRNLLSIIVGLGFVFLYECLNH